MPKAKIQQPEIKPVCGNCPLDTCSLLQHPKMLPTGSVDPIIYILGEAPGATEDQQGIQFIGKAGQFLRKFIPSEYLEFIRWNNVINCRPAGNATPGPVETHCCRPRQVSDIEATKPKQIWGFGAVPLEWAIGEGAKKAPSIMAWRGRHFPIRIGSHVCWYYPMLHPSYLIRQGGENANRDLTLDTIRVFDVDLQKAMFDLENLPDASEFIEDPASYEAGIHCLRESTAIEMGLDAISEWPVASIDLETNGLRPYKLGAKVLTVAVSHGDETYVFPGSFLGVILDRFKGKPLIAHSAKFELEWCGYFYSQQTFKIRWEDTMGQAYTLDERKGCLSLDDLVVLHFGFRLKALSDLDVTNLENEKLEDVMLYNGLDAKYTFYLWQRQADLLKQEGLLETYELAIGALIPITLMQLHGLEVNWDEVKKQDSQLRAKIIKTQDKINGLPEVQKFITDRRTALMKAVKRPTELLKIRAMPDRDIFNLGSWQQVKAFFAGQFIYLESTDAEHMAEVKHPVARLLLEYRESNKLLSTYITPIVDREVVHDDGLIHPSYNLYFTGTGRLSCDSPNIQNYPSREHAEIRNVIKAPPGHKLVSFDLGQIEARIIAEASKDAYFIKALHDGYDIHLEWAQKLAEAEPKLLKRFKDMKRLRTEVKNMWVFPAFFGATLGAVSLYLSVKDTILEPLFNEFWHRFAGVKKWQQQLLKGYKENGFVSTLTGRRRHGPMKTNEAINQPVQGTAADVLLKAEIALTKLAIEEGLDWLVPVMNIHDDLTFYIPNDLVEEATPLIAEIICTPGFSWLTVPLTVEVSVGDTWGAKEKKAVYDSRQFTKKVD